MTRAHDTASPAVRKAHGLPDGGNSSEKGRISPQAVPDGGPAGAEDRAAARRRAIKIKRDAWLLTTKGLAYRERERRRAKEAYAAKALQRAAGQAGAA